MSFFFEEPSQPIYQLIRQPQSQSVPQPSRNVINHGRWLENEHDAFLEGLNRYGKDWRSISGEIRTRILSQTRSHAQKYFRKIANEAQKVENNKQAIIGSLQDKILTREQCEKRRIKSKSQRSNITKNYYFRQNAVEKPLNYRKIHNSYDYL